MHDTLTGSERRWKADQEREEAHDSAEKARDALEWGRLDQARDLALRALDLDRALPLAHWVLASVALGEDDHRAVATHMAVLDRTVPLVGKDLQLYVHALAQAGEAERALLRATDALRGGKALAAAERRALERLVTLAREEVARRIASKARSSAPPAEPARPRASPAAPPELRLDFRWEKGPLEEALHGGVLSGEARHALALEAARFGLAQGFDELLCLSSLVGVERLPHQEATVRAVLRRFRGRALLADEVGLGKTIEAAMVAKEVILRGLARRVLVLAPAGLVRQWREELASKFLLAFEEAQGARLREDPSFWATQDLVVASLALARRAEHAQRLAAVEWDLVIVDEAHRLRRRGSASWKLVDVLQRRFLLLLTATPVQNDLEELYNIITLLRPGTLGTPAQFRGRFVGRSDARVPRDRERLRELMSEVMVRNTRASIDLTLPRRRAETIRVAPSPAEEALHAGVTALCRALHAEGATDRLSLGHAGMALGAGGAALAARLAAMAGRPDLGAERAAQAARLAQAAREAGPSRKLDQLGRIVAARGDPVLVFARYRESVEEIARELDGRGHETVVYHGGLSADQREGAVLRFREGARVMVATESGGEGRNLQFCRLLVNYDLPWNPMRIEQRIGRLHRIGQAREVHVFNLALRGGLDDRLLTILDEKINLFELVVGELDLILGDLTEEREFDELVLDCWAGAADAGESERRLADLGDQLTRARAAYEATRQLDEALFGKDHEA